MLWPKTQICYEGEGAAAGAAAASATPWFAGADPELVGHIQNREMDKKDAKEAALHFAKAHREAAKFVGHPVDQLLKLPAQNDTDGWKAFYQKIGAPVDAKDYEFKDAAGKPLEAKVDAVLREAAAKVNLPKAQASEIGAAVAKMLETDKTSSAADKQAALITEKEKLATSWGGNRESNMVVAKNAAAALGVTAADVAALESVVGYSRVMELFRNVGMKIGEGKFITSNNGGGDAIMTKEQATTARADLMQDKNWVKRYMDGGVQEKRQMTDLQKIIAGVA